MIGEDHLEANWVKIIKRRYCRLGCSYITIGALSFAIPLFTAVSERTFLGSVFLALGAMMGWNVLEGFRAGDKPWSQTLISVTTWIAGLVLLFHPLSEVIMMGFFIATYFFVDGIMRVLEFIRLRTMKGSFWILISGILEVAFGFASWGDVYSYMPRIKLMLSIYLMIAGAFSILSSRK